MSILTQAASYASQAAKYVCTKTDQFLTNHPNLRTSISKHARWVALASGAGFLSSGSLLSLGVCGLSTFAHYRARSLAGRAAHIQAATDNFPLKNVVLKRHTKDFARLYVAEGIKQFSLDVCGVVAEYVCGPVYNKKGEILGGVLMDREGFQEWYGVDIGEESDKVKEKLKFEAFYEKFHGPNTIDLFYQRDRIRQVCESSHIPFVLPQVVGFPDGTTKRFCLIVMEGMAKHPKKGHPAKFKNQTTALDQLGTKEAEEQDLVFLLDEVVARNKPWSKKSKDPKEMGQVETVNQISATTGHPCRIPDTLRQVAAQFIHHTVIGKWLFGEGTYGRTTDRVQIGRNEYPAVSGWGQEASGAAPAVLNVNFSSSFDYESIGVGVLR